MQFMSTGGIRMIPQKGTKCNDCGNDATVEGAGLIYVRETNDGKHWENVPKCYNCWKMGRLNLE